MSSIEDQRLTQGRRFAEFSLAFRESKLNRLVQVPAGKRNWCPVPGGMTIADIAHHIGETDGCVGKMLAGAAVLRTRNNTATRRKKF